jgi:hypothetical protein
MMRYSAARNREYQRRWEARQRELVRLAHAHRHRPGTYLGIDVDIEGAGIVGTADATDCRAEEDERRADETRCHTNPPELPSEKIVLVCSRCAAGRGWIPKG